MGTRLTHIALHVDGISACIDFYRRYCKLEITDDQERGGRRMVLMAEPGRGASFVLQLIGGGADKASTPDDDRHFGFAADSREEVDRCVAMAKEDDILLFDIFEGPFPIGYICGVRDPNGNTVEISFGHLLESEVH